ncbi:unnamed protein product [Caenorhabditis auriculariae]|uniref:Uncharacterized protein n=1 Tax=Caenorhabditis auriculariae TaxID=2777116 RepID=A0A8S1GY48_9PELO|nr:unnamed protein product [Caenorhabditis auriculariae]
MRRFSVLLPYLLIVLLVSVHSRSLVTSKNKEKSCKAYKRAALHEVLDRICHLCHEMFSTKRPNMRADCRSNCFRNGHFRACIALFRPSLDSLFGSLQ